MRSRACYLYVLPLAYEDILKLGISNDPLVRAQAFSRRYYEFFDLSRSLLVEFDSKPEAQARETELHRRLREWNAVQPTTVPGAAAGKTEWYRGAYATLHDAIKEDIAGGRVVYVPALEWWRMRLLDEREKLYEWASMLIRLDEACASEDRMGLLNEALGAYLALDIPLNGCLPQEQIPGQA